MLIVDAISLFHLFFLFKKPYTGTKLRALPPTQVTPARAKKREISAQNLDFLNEKKWAPNDYCRNIEHGWRLESTDTRVGTVSQRRKSKPSISPNPRMSPSIRSASRVPPRSLGRVPTLRRLQGKSKGKPSLYMRSTLR